MTEEFNSKVSSLRRKLATASKEVTEINECGRLALTNESKVCIFKGLFRTIEKYYSKFESVWEDLVDLYDSMGKAAEFPKKPDHETFARIQRYYKESHTSYELITRNETASAVAASVSNITMAEPRPTTLPRLTLPKFDGSYTNWPKFRDSFVSIVNGDKTLSNIEKFHYLVSTISGNASVVIRHLPITEQNYPLAWKALVDTYDNKRILANSYLNILMNFKPWQGKPNAASHMQFLSSIADTIAAFKLLAIPDTSEFVLFFLAFRCLDSHTKESFELANKDTEFPTFDDLITFVRNRCTALQLSEGNNINLEHSPNSGNKVFYDMRNKHLSKQSGRNKTTLLSAGPKFKSKEPQNTLIQQYSKCPICHSVSPHAILNCPNFYNMSPDERSRRLKEWKGCTNCLSSQHSTPECRSKWHCRFCPQRHNSFLHPLEKHPVTPVAQSRQDQSSTAPPSTSTSMNCTHSNDSTVQILLGTALADFLDNNGCYQTFRIVIDCGSQHSFMTTHCFNKLGLNLDRFKKKISGIGGSLFEGAKGTTHCTLISKDRLAIYNTDAVVVKNITNFLPTVQLPHNVWRKYLNCDLADPIFWEPKSIDFLVGADLYADVILSGPTSIGENLPKLFQSVFGDIIMGRYFDDHSTTLVSTSLLCQNNDFEFDLSKFWEIEEIKSPLKRQDPKDVRAEEFFVKTHFRQDDGRYVVRLPFTEPNLNFPSSYSIAKRRFENLENKLKNNPSLKEQYDNFMLEYIQLGHMRETCDDSKFVIPHHCVTKEDRGEIKIRVVFDGSVKTGPNGSLNDNLLVGPSLQNDIRDVLLNFRRHCVVFLGDAVKMYRQILVEYQDRPYQHVLWRFDSAEAIKCYELCTVTYGLSCSPFLSLRTLQALQEDEGPSFPKAVEVLSKNIYIDDVAAGASDVNEALELQRQLIGLMERGGFSMSKWASNHPALLEVVQEEGKPSTNLPISWSESEGSIKVLGLQWEPTSDCFTYKIQPPVYSTISKRTMLSTVARIYDPLGFISPFIFLRKGFVQELWKIRLEWDDKVPEHLAVGWKELVNQLDLLTQIKIPRFAFCQEPFEFQIVGFSDASQKGYCGVLYVRVMVMGKVHSVTLLTSKTKLAPIKPLSIPRLELCAALLLSKLYLSIHEFLSTLPPTSHQPRFFSDSSIVLGWMKTPTYKLKTFVATRIENIGELTDLSLWSHIDSQDNPSDHGSRGLTPENLLKNSQWWHGPSWLNLPESEWPCMHQFHVRELPELKVTTPSVLTTTKSGVEECISWISRISTYGKLLRVVAVLSRGMHLWKGQGLITKGLLRSSDLRDSEQCIIKFIQRYYLFSGKVPDVSRLTQQFGCLTPFIDSEGVARVGGCLSQSNLPENQKHPILLPSRSHFTNLIIDHFHQVYLHPGPNLSQALIQTRFWIPSARRIIRHRSFLCLTCFKAKAKPIYPIMGDLPSYRLQGGRAFLHTGVDFAGPFTVKESKRRKAPQSKAYLCLFVCMTTKALHLETVTNLTSEAFLAALSRFISRRGLPSDLYSDCGTNFKGAEKELRELIRWFQEERTQEEIITYTANRTINWHFNPPYSPHFGGLWEAGVKVVKRHLHFTAGLTPLTFEELSTLFCRIEAILNSRPLCPLSSDPSEFNFLSPGHFLIGSPLVTNPEPTLLDIADNQLSRWQLIKKMSEHIWGRWHLEYLSTLQARNKWRKPTANLEIGDLVLIKHQNTAPLAWPTARVIDVHPGEDGVVRVVTLKTPAATHKRTSANLIPLLPLKMPIHPADSDPIP